MSTRLSPDGMYYWDGQAWVSTLSHDGRSRWDGTQWVATSGTPYAPPRGMREPTSWTRPLQYAVITWYAFSAIYAATIPFWMGSAMSQIMNQAIQRQEAGSGQAMPPGFAETMTSLMTVVFWVSAGFAIAISAVAIIGAIRRWTWAYYAVLVLLGLGALGLPLNLINAVSGGSLNSAEGFSLPAWALWVSIATGLAGTALFVWMLVALVKRGPWAMRRPGSVG
jgi:hypothetical protein